MGKDARSAAVPASAGASSLPPPTGKPPEPKNFEFVLVTDSESRRQVRRHAMRQYMRQRRLEGIARLEASRVPVAGWSASRPDNSASTPSRVQEPKEENAGNRDVPNGSGEGGMANARSPVASNANFHVVRRHDAYPLRITNTGTSNPRATPGTGGMRDPFNSYPILINNQADHELINHCKSAPRPGDWHGRFCSFVALSHFIRTLREHQYDEKSRLASSFVWLPAYSRKLW